MASNLRAAIASILRAMASIVLGVYFNEETLAQWVDWSIFLLPGG